MKELFVNTQVPVGCCSSDTAHFRGAARELYTYIKRLAENNHGFVFATAPDLARHAKNGGAMEGIFRSAIASVCSEFFDGSGLSAVGTPSTSGPVAARAAAVSTRRMGHHPGWPMRVQNWPAFETTRAYLMGNGCPYEGANEGSNEGAYEGAYEGAHCRKNVVSIN